MQGSLQVPVAVE